MGQGRPAPEMNREELIARLALEYGVDQRLFRPMSQEDLDWALVIITGHRKAVLDTRVTRV